jgi:UDP-N-acetylglucosamine 2-epimerase (non-hydrolysing)
VVDKLKSDKALAAGQVDVLKAAGYDITRLSSCHSERSEESMRKLVLITGHRRENFGQGFINMVTAMKDLSEKYPEVDFVYPMHLNPNVRKPIHEVFGKDLTAYPNFFFTEPLQYLEFVYLMEKSTLVLTDSGGIQEEAPGLGKPVLVMRDTTERPEALSAGTVKLVGTNHDLIVREVSTLLDDPEAYEKMSHAVNPYGDGQACGRIVEAMN